jgi:hypothetical protein
MTVSVLESTEMLIVWSMDESREDFLVRCFTVLREGNGPFVSEASSALEQLYQDGSVVVDLARVAMNHPNEIIRRYGLVGLVHNLKPALDSLPEDQVTWTKSTLITLVQREVSLANLEYLFDICCDFAEAFRTRGGFPEFLQILVDATQSDAQRSIALFGWSNAIRADLFSAAELSPLLSGLMAALLSRLNSANGGDRFHSILLLHSIISTGFFPSLFSSFPEAIPMLDREGVLAITTGDELENIQLVSLLCLLAQSEWDNFDLCNIILPEFCLNVIANPAIPAGIRDIWFAYLVNFSECGDWLE